MSLNPVTFRWKDAQQDASQGLQYGFIAQEVQKVYPEFVTLGGETKVNHEDGSFETVENTLGVSHTSLISPLVKAVQEIYYMVVGYKADLMSQMKIKDDEIKTLSEENRWIKAKSQAIEAKAQETEKRLNLLLKVLCTKDQSAEFCL